MFDVMTLNCASADRNEVKQKYACRLLRTNVSKIHVSVISNSLRLHLTQSFFVAEQHVISVSSIFILQEIRSYRNTDFKMKRIKVDVSHLGSNS